MSVSFNNVGMFLFVVFQWYIYQPVDGATAVQFTEATGHRTEALKTCHLVSLISINNNTFYLEGAFLGTQGHCTRVRRALIIR